jgi:hypothetical protein
MKPRFSVPIESGLVVAVLCLTPCPAWADKNDTFGIQVVDAQTARGVPLIELRTVNDIVHHTDSAGWVAFNEPGLMDREVYFHVAGPGYEHPKDGFGFRGVRLKTTPGTTCTVKVKRINIAERVYRVTGQGIYRDSVLLGLPAPIESLRTGVLGQDSVQSTPYRGQIFWLWGDTNLANYPLGNFQTTAAMSPLGRADKAIPLHYFADAKNPDRVRHMAPLKEPGPVWLFGLLTVNDEKGNEALVSHYSRRKSLGEQLEHGLVRFNDDTGVFERLVVLDPKNTWQFPRGNAIRVHEMDGDYFYFASPLCHTRVKATWQAVRDPEQYEAFVLDPKTGTYSWRRDVEPTTQAAERRLLREHRIPETAVHYALHDTTGKSVLIHGGSINCNAYRKKWILIGLQQGDRDTKSFLGEVLYAEADAITGPWRKAVKIASHPRYSFYNPRHHAFFDEDGGRVIYFEGTYTHTFSGNPTPTPRYDYNQLMYRLDLSDERLHAVR